jgi:hypothetical protein
VLKLIAFALAVMSAVLGLASAWYWWRTSKVETIPTWARYGGMEPVVQGLSAGGWIVGLLQAGQISAELNRKAVLTGAAVALGVIANVLSMWPIF